jgi:hypothetical protein
MTAIETTTIQHIPAVSLEERRDMLAARLETGFQKIEQAERIGTDTTRWEHAWMRLLNEYEQICDQIQSRPARRS